MNKPSRIPLGDLPSFVLGFCRDAAEDDPAQVLQPLSCRWQPPVAQGVDLGQFDPLGSPGDLFGFC